MLSKKIHRSRLFFLSIAILGSASTAFGGTRVLGSSGWQAMWASSLDPYVDIVFDAYIGDAVYIQKSADFTQPPGPNGLIPSIPITFQQIAFPAATHIVINDEIIFNHTGASWTDFHMQLLDSGDALFNPAATNASAGGTGFHTEPFTNQAFSNGNTTFDVNGFGLGPGGSDATIPNNTAWFPGDGAFDGELWIDVNPHANAPYTVFTLKETPTIPEPATAALVAIGMLFSSRRRSRLA